MKIIDIETLHDLDIGQYAREPQYRRATPNMMWTCHALSSLLKRNKEVVEEFKNECAYIGGSGHGELGATEEYILLLGLQNRPKPIAFQNSLHNSTLGFATHLFGLSGPGLTVSNGWWTVEDQLHLAETLIESGVTKYCIIAVSDIVVPNLKDAIHSIYPSPVELKDFAGVALVGSDTCEGVSIVKLNRMDSEASELKSFDGWDGFLGHPIRQISNNENQVFLTFDDGPVKGQTDQVLDLLKGLDVKATFFLIGDRVVEEPSLAKRMREEGHSIGNHSLDHDYRMFFCSEKKIADWIERGRETLEKHLGPTVGFRPPAGVISPPLKRAVQVLDTDVFLWRHRYFDSFTGLKKFSVNDVKSGDLLLLHDAILRGSSLCSHLENLEKLISSLKEKGFALTSIPRR